MGLSKFVLTMLAGLLVMSCANHGKQTVVEAISEPEDEIITGLQETEPIKIKISLKGARPMSQSFSDKEVLILPDTCENFVGIPGYIRVCGDTLFIIDPVKWPGFYAYLHDGQQLFSYCSRGSGPEDIGMLFGLNASDSLLSSFDMPSSSLVFVDKKGKFAKRVAINPMACSAIADRSGGIWTDYSNQEYETTRLSWRTTPESEEIEILPVPEHLKGMTAVDGHPFSSLEDGTINYRPAIEPYVYGLSNGKAWLKYELDFGSLWPDESTIKREFGGNDWAIKFSSFPISMIKIEENAQWLIISFNYIDDKYIHIYDKTASRGVTYRDDIEGYYSPAYVSGDKMYIPTKDDTIEIINLASRK